MNCKLVFFFTNCLIGRLHEYVDGAFVLTVLGIVHANITTRYQLRGRDRQKGFKYFNGGYFYPFRSCAAARCCGKWGSSTDVLFLFGQNNLIILIRN